MFRGLPRKDSVRAGEVKTWEDCFFSGGERALPRSIWDLSSSTRDQTRSSCILALGVQSFNHGSFGEVPRLSAARGTQGLLRQ